MDKFKRVKTAKRIEDAEPLTKGKTVEDPEAWRNERTSLTITKGLLWDLKHEAFQAKMSLSEYVRQIFDNRKKS